jgi:hypothetical protein
MKERPKPKENLEAEDYEIFDNQSSTHTEHFLNTRPDEKLLSDMQEMEEYLNFCQDVIEEIKTLTEYHVLPIAEHLSIEHVEAFLEKIKNQ